MFLAAFRAANTQGDTYPGVASNGILLFSAESDS